MVGVLSDDTDPMVAVMKLEKAPTESYADIGGLDTQIQEIKESVELPLTHPEYYEEMGIKPPKGVRDTTRICLNFALWICFHPYLFPLVFVSAGDPVRPPRHRQDPHGQADWPDAQLQGA